ncbi:hypothetical protein [Ferribacterium limneticum]|uniref:hypothetical protein n=1 Tax=Ferribacterium limneticum TaxID=76259 RepID=UPI001CFC3FBC|nr:hypothetical protein [Ferribacterium limneticum]UCV18276.1 hypothetical protein KI610_15940 [Ferribacterium limneticum]
MKLILHIGMPKTGTTALQAQLSADRASLLRHGVLYPQVNIHPTNHNFLALLMRHGDAMAPRFRAMYGKQTDLLWKDFESNWQQIKRQIAKHQPHTVILSGEGMFFAIGSTDTEKFRARILELTDDVQVVAYVRQPSRHYLSAVQQRLKSAAKFNPPGAPPMRKTIEAAWEMFGRKPMVIPYERDLLLDGDITSDFLHRCVPEVSSFAGRIVSAELNESLSAEVMAILQEYRQTKHKDADGDIPVDCVRLQRLLQHIEHRHGLYRRPVLVAEVARHIDDTSVDLLWLEEQYGFRFSGIDYAAIRGESNPIWNTFSQISDICVVDAEKKRQLLMLASRQPLRPRLVIPRRLMRWAERNAGGRVVAWVRTAFRWCGRKSSVTR